MGVIVWWFVWDLKNNFYIKKMVLIIFGLIDKYLWFLYGLLKLVDEMIIVIEIFILEI